MAFIAAPKADGCVFCAICAGKEDPAEYVLWRGTEAMCLLNKYPYNPSHLLILPYQHGDDLAALPLAAQQELMWLMGRSMRILRETVGAEGINCGLNQGAVGGAGIREHLHFHVIPRWNGDTNFLPLLAETKSMPEHLEATYARLAPAFAAVTAPMRGGTSCDA